MARAAWAAAVVGMPGAPHPVQQDEADSGLGLLWALQARMPSACSAHNPSCGSNVQQSAMDVPKSALPPPGCCTALRRHGAGALHRCSAPQPIHLSGALPWPPSRCQAGIVAARRRGSRRQSGAVKAWQCSGAGPYTVPLRQLVRRQAESTVQQRLAGALSTALARCLALQAPAQCCARQARIGRVCRSDPLLGNTDSSYTGFYGQCSLPTGRSA